MRASEIRKLLGGVENFGGVIPADWVKECESEKLYIINSAPSSDPGKHWVAVYLTTVPEFFDTLGHSPEFYRNKFEDFMIEHGPKYVYNPRRVQNYGSSLCGQFCIYYIMSRIRGNPMGEIVKKN